MATPERLSVSLPERYTLVRHVADGGMASVWEATDELLGRPVAVKVLSAAFAADEGARRRFTREARAAARLSTHPHVVTVYDAGEQDGQAFLVMALYTGGTVADRIKAQVVPRAQALDWLEDAASALDLAHAEGVVHRDVKPANLLLDADDRVAVADFGIATAAWETSMTQTGMVLGTLAYLAPEQRTGGTATAASDRYALGLVARELLTGARPGTPATNPVGLPGAAEVALQRATAEDPDARPASCTALVEELEAALGEGDATAATQTARPRAAAAPLPGGPAATAAHAAPVAARTPLPPRRAAGPPAGADAPPDGGRGGKLLALLAVAALLVGVVVAVASSGGDDPASQKRPSDSTQEGQGKAPADKSTSTPAAPAEPPAGEQPADGAPAKSRAELIAQNNRAFAATRSDPAGQVAPLREAMAGLCKDESDINCAYALFNLAQALRLSGQPAEAIPLLEKRLAISDNQVGTVREELAAAQEAAGVAPAGGAPAGKGNGKGRDKDDD